MRYKKELIYCGLGLLLVCNYDFIRRILNRENKVREWRELTIADCIESLTNEIAQRTDIPRSPGLIDSICKNQPTNLNYKLAFDRYQQIILDLQQKP